MPPRQEAAGEWATYADLGLRWHCSARQARRLAAKLGLRKRREGHEIAVSMADVLACETAWGWHDPPRTRR